ncbi:ribonuclease HI family protein [uncultured Limosilactobacillus sp.]|uniref:ribonuclease HI family protein n=1 Tax=uncultured Limosilactobacillus sp. TaxID=2837629 RepID=UPI0025CB9F47|nr:ribonuclease HI family protein [uncultured Limosilactobacillus sp.]
MIKIYSDAAVSGNPGPAGAGCLIIINGQQHQFSHSLPATDNHHAEFMAAIWAFEQLAQFKSADQIIFFYTDSRLVSDAIGKGYAKKYAAELSRLLTLIDQYPTVVTEWLPEKLNHGAHQLALQALHQSHT